MGHRVGPSFGGVEGLVEQQVAISGYCELTSEEQAAIGISDSLVRLVVGVENVDPLGTDLEKALDRVFSSKKG